MIDTSIICIDSHSFTFSTWSVLSSTCNYHYQKGFEITDGITKIRKSKDKQTIQWPRETGQKDRQTTQWPRETGQKDRQTTQWPRETGQKDKQRSTKHYT